MVKFIFLHNFSSIYYANDKFSINLIDIALTTLFFHLYNIMECNRGKTSNNKI